MRIITRAVLAGIGAVLTISGCADTKTPVRHGRPTAPPSAPAATSGQATANQPDSTATTPGGTPATRPTGAVGVGGSGPCPVDAITLYAALRSGDQSYYDRAANPAALANPVCVDGFAVAKTVPAPERQATLILFVFDRAAAAWRPLNLGSADLCDSQVPSDVAARLPGCS
jgi:hypothetical protein